MTDTPVQTAQPLSLPARMVGVLFSPRETFANVALFPRWFGVMAVSLVIFAAAQGAFLSTDVGRTAVLDQQVAAMEGFGMTVNDEVYERLKSQAAYAPYTQAAGILIAAPLFTFLIAGILFGIFSGAMGGQASYKQVLSILAHTSVLNIVQALFITPLNYARASLSSATSFGVFFPMFEEGSFIANVLGSIDLFILWSLTLTAIGLGVLYKRKTTPILVSLLIVYACIAVAIAAVKAALGGS